MHPSIPKAKLMKRHLLLTIISFLLLQGMQAQITVNHLQCERLNDPLGIDVKTPRFSWQIVSRMRDTRQTGYHLLIASSRELLAKNEGDIWNPGRVNSSESILVPY